MADKKVKIKLDCDASPAISFIELFKDAIERFGCRVKLSDIPSDLVRIEQNPCPAGASEVLIRLYPSDAFLRFAAATLTRKFNLGLIDDPGNHKSSFCRGLRRYKFRLFGLTIADFEIIEGRFK